MRVLTVSSNISQCSTHMLIRDDTLRLNSSFVQKRFYLNERFNNSRNCRHSTHMHLTPFSQSATHVYVVFTGEPVDIGSALPAGDVMLGLCLELPEYCADDQQ
jgi:hypothetical protein